MRGRASAPSDFLPAPFAGERGSTVVRIAEARSGAVPVTARLSAGDGFQAGRATLTRRGDAIAIGPPQRPVAHLVATEPLKASDDVAGVSVRVERGRALVMVLSHRLPPPGPLTSAALAARERTIEWWRAWVDTLRLPRTRRAAVVRSALTLKLLEYEPTRALVAAPTTWLPERVGGSRNWDYRYTWLRDSSMMVLAVQELGSHGEAMAYWSWLSATAERHGDDLSVV